MDSREIRALVRDVLTEEYGGPPTPAPLCEVVAVRTDGELMAFAHKLLALSEDPQSRDNIKNGRMVFRLDNSPALRRDAIAPPPKPVIEETAPRFERGFINERHVEALDESVARISITRSVRLTPLARDRLRQRGITVERSEK